MNEKNIAIIDDDEHFISRLSVGLRGNRLLTATSADEAITLVKEHHTHLILLDLNLDPSHESQLEGLELIPVIKQIAPNTPLVVITADETTETVVQAMKLGADDFLRKSAFDLLAWRKKFELLISNRQLTQRLHEMESEQFRFIGNSTTIRGIKRTLGALVDHPEITILLTGETGVGKEVAARFLHQSGPRKDKPFVAVNLSSITESMLESTLFGHRKGAFTGAHSNHTGYFRQADEGIIFLDEIGDINSTIQLKMLRFLETHTIRPVGADRSYKLDVQVIAATNRNLLEYTNRGDFRSDLYYRLRNFEVEIPPLRHHLEDIEDLVSFFVLQLGYEKWESIITTETMEQLKIYEWPGNVRELRNTVDYLVLRARILGLSTATPECLPSNILQGQLTSPTMKGLSSTDYLQENRIRELNAIEEALRIANGRKSDAARSLNLNTDQLRYRVKKLSVEGDLSQYPAIWTAYGRRFAD